MAHFYGRLIGRGNPVTCCGNRKGIDGKIQGEEIGCFAAMKYSGSDDEIDIYVTRGQSGGKAVLLFSGNRLDLEELIEREIKKEKGGEVSNLQEGL